MADLTAPQILTIRRRIGDNKTDNSSAYELSDATIEAIFDDATMGDSDMLKTTVWCLRERLGMAVNGVALSGELGNASHNQKFEQIERLLAFWEDRAGMTGGAISTGSLALRIDYTGADETADASL